MIGMCSCGDKGVCRWCEANDPPCECSNPIRCAKSGHCWQTPSRTFVQAKAMWGKVT